MTIAAAAALVVVVVLMLLLVLALPHPVQCWGATEQHTALAQEHHVCCQVNASEGGR